MQKAQITKLLLEFCHPDTDVRRANQIQIIFNAEIEKTCAKKDVDAFDLLMSSILIDNGRRRAAEQVMSAFPVLCMILGEKPNMRLADWPS